MMKKCVGDFVSYFCPCDKLLISDIYNLSRDLLPLGLGGRQGQEAVLIARPHRVRRRHNSPQDRSGIPDSSCRFWRSRALFQTKRVHPAWRDRIVSCPGVGTRRNLTARRVFMASIQAKPRHALYLLLKDGALRRFSGQIVRSRRKSGGWREAGEKRVALKRSAEDNQDRAEVRIAPFMRSWSGSTIRRPGASARGFSVNERFRLGPGIRGGCAQDPRTGGLEPSRSPHEDRGSLVVLPGIIVDHGLKKPLRIPVLENVASGGL